MAQQILSGFLSEDNSSQNMHPVQYNKLYRMEKKFIIR